MASLQLDLPPDLAAELERKYFWWEPIGSRARSDARILAQAMEFASYDDIRRIEQTIGQRPLAALMRLAEPGWLSERSWEFWRGRLIEGTGEAIPEMPPRRTFDAKAF